MGPNGSSPVKRSVQEDEWNYFSPPKRAIPHLKMCGGSEGCNFQNRFRFSFDTGTMTLKHLLTATLIPCRLEPVVKAPKHSSRHFLPQASRASRHNWSHHLPLFRPHVLECHNPRRCGG
eukprot:scaffold583_cov176-Amphora_coffeaeformis.AAC.10